MHRRRIWFHIVGALVSTLIMVTTESAFAQSNSYDIGLKQYKAGQFAQAANSLLSAVKQPGKEASAYYYLACCYYKLNRTSDARAIYRTIVKDFASSHEAELSATMLARLDPGYVAAAAPSQDAVTASDSTQRRPSRQPLEDYSKLPDEARIPFTVDSSGHMLVNVYLNDRPLEAWFDTGANAHFGKNHLLAAGIQPPRGAPNSVRRGWAGSDVQVWALPMKLKMGNMTRTAITSIEENMASKPLVGQEFIQGFQCEVDNGSHYIILKKLSSQGASSSSSAQTSSLYDVPCIRRSMRDYVTITINGRQMEVLIDTGADHSIFSEEDLNAVGIRVPEDAQIQTGTGVGGAFSVRLMSAEVRLGPIWKKDFTIRAGGSSGSAVGQDLLGTQRFTIDRQRNLMRFFH